MTEATLEKLLICLSTDIEYMALLLIKSSKEYTDELKSTHDIRKYCNILADTLSPCSQFIRRFAEHLHGILIRCDFGNDYSEILNKLELISTGQDADNQPEGNLNDASTSETARPNTNNVESLKTLDCEQENSEDASTDKDDMPIWIHDSDSEHDTITSDDKTRYNYITETKNMISAYQLDSPVSETKDSEASEDDEVVDIWKDYVVVDETFKDTQSTTEPNISPKNNENFANVRKNEENTETEKQEEEMNSNLSELVDMYISSPSSSSSNSGSNSDVEENLFDNSNSLDEDSRQVTFCLFLKEIFLQDIEKYCINQNPLIAMIGKQLKANQKRKYSFRRTKSSNKRDKVPTKIRRKTSNADCITNSKRAKSYNTIQKHKNEIRNKRGVESESTFRRKALNEGRDAREDAVRIFIRRYIKDLEIRSRPEHSLFISQIIEKGIQKFAAHQTEAVTMVKNWIIN